MAVLHQSYTTTWCGWHGSNRGHRDQPTMKLSYHSGKGQVPHRGQNLNPTGRRCHPGHKGHTLPHSP